MQSQQRHECERRLHAREMQRRGRGKGRLQRAFRSLIRKWITESIPGIGLPSSLNASALQGGEGEGTRCVRRGRRLPRQEGPGADALACAGELAGTIPHLALAVTPLSEDSPGVLIESGLVEVSLELLVRVALAFDPRQRETQPLIPRRHRPRSR